jgi:DNA ligase (NAD+)
VSQARIDDLAKQITDAKTAYYHGTPIMSDAAYDALESELRSRDPNHPVLKQVGAAVPGTSGWPKVKHGMPMSSLNKAQDADELKAWYTSCSQPTRLFVTEKMDGISVALRYENGTMTQALTRGDGEIGEDITRNVLYMKGFPRQAGSFTGWVRGEIVCLKSDFAKHFPNDSNPRNTASGTAKRQSDPDPCRHLTVFAYQMLPDASPIRLKQEELMALDGHGFMVPNHKAVNGIGAVEDLYKGYVDTHRAALDYDIDGLVVEVNDTADREALGDKNHRPKGATAYKFPHEQKETYLRDVVWQVGNSGRITPVAVFDTVSLAGANVGKASLHNVDYYHEIAKQMSEGVLADGDKILVSRRNDVIPHVEQGLVAASTPNNPRSIFPVPTTCPECGGPLSTDGKYLVCRNTLGCPAQVAGAIKRWVKKIGVLQWGDSVIEALVDQGLVDDAADLYELQDDVLSDVRMGGRRVGSSAKTMLDNLHAKTDLPLYVILGSIGIPFIGRSMARTIVNGGFETLDKCFKATSFEIASIAGVGGTKADAFVQGMEDGIGLVCKLLANGVTVAAPPKDGPLKGKLVCMTGFRDPGMQAAIEAQGGVVKGSVSKKLDYLVCADPNSTSGKAKKARKYGIDIVGRDDMNKLLGR